MEALRSSLDPNVLETSLYDAPERGRLGRGSSSCSHRSDGRFDPVGGDAVREDSPGYEVGA